MANTLGQLIVRMGLDATEFVSGLTKSEYEAKKLADRIDRGISKAADIAALAIAGIGAAAGAAYFAVDKLVKQAGDFQDLAEKTGSSAEALASFAVAARIGNAEMSAVADASVKLTKNLVGVDDEGKAAGAAIASLGLDLKSFKQLDPAAQMDAVAKAMAGFADGAGKTAVATALFGKSGAQLLPFLKELGEGVGRQNILTAEQIKLADEYADKQAKARAELNLHAQALATQMLPAMTAFTGAITDTVKELLSLGKEAGNLGNGDAITRFSERGAVALANMAEIAIKTGVYFVGLANTIGGAAAAVAAVGRGEFSIAGKIVDAVRADNRADREFLAKLDLAAKVEEKFRQLREGGGGTTGDFARADRNRKGQVNFQGAQAAGATARTSEAERYLESLIKQLQKTEELTLVETALRDIQSGRLAGITPKLQEQILGTARLIDLHKAEADSLKASEAAAKKAADAASELFRQATQFALAVETPAEKLTRQMEELNKAVENNPLITSDVAARNAQKYWEDFVKTLEVAKTTVTEADQFAKHAAENIQDYLGQGLYDVLSGNFQNIGKSFTNMINRMIAEAASAQISRYLFGDLLKGGEGGGSGVLGGIFSSIAQAFFPGASGGGLTTGDFARLDRRAAGGPVDAGGMYRVNENGPELLDVNGRQFLMMGNQRGTVIPNDRLGGMGGDTYHIAISVPYGTPRDTASQMAAELQRKLSAGGRNR